MSKTPKEIWCSSGLYYDYVTDWSNGSWCRDNDGGVKYVRADCIEELEVKLAKAVCFLIGLDRHGVYTTDQLEDLVAELKGETNE